MLERRSGTKAERSSKQCTKGGSVQKRCSCVRIDRIGMQCFEQGTESKKVF